MYRKLFAAVAAIAVLATTQANAGGSGRHVDKRIKATALVVGAASTATYFSINGWEWKWNSTNAIPAAGAYALTTVGCMAVSPMVATLLVKRPLTQREGHILAGSCLVPIIGGYLVNAAYNAHPEWDPASAPAKRHAKKKKM